MTMTDTASGVTQSSPTQISQQKPPSPFTSPISSFLAGIAGGSVSTILLYPLDLIKVRMQVDEGPRNSALDGTAAVTHHQHKHSPSNSVDRPRTICTTVRSVIRHEGYIGLYRGLSPAIIGSAASWGGFFILYEEMKKQMFLMKNQARSNNATISSEVQEQPLKLGPTDHFAASCLAGVCMVALTNPLWLIKTRLQLQNSRLQTRIASISDTPQKVKPAYRGLFHAAYTIVQEEGIFALYKGSVPALMLVSHGGIQFVTYEFLKGHFAAFTSNGKTKRENARQRRSESTIGERLHDSMGYLVMGAMSKFVASTTTYPLQVIKARLQQRSQAIEVSETTGEIIVTKREYSGVMDCIGKIYKNEGMYGFFKGCLTNAIRVAPSAAITFVTYELVLDTLNGR